MHRVKDSDCVFISANNYAHKSCLELEERREKTDEEKLDEYIKKLFQIEYVGPQIKKQIKQFVTEYNFTYSGILKALQYFYDIKGNSIEKANGRISIVPYIYKDAYNYHYKLWLAQQKNQDIEIELYVPKVKEITIPTPERKIKKRKLFMFLDEEAERGE